MISPGIADAAGVFHQRARGDFRIVSLVPSITELLIDLGLADAVVGRTGFCIHPRDAVHAIPKVGGTKDVKVDRVRELAPTHVVVNVDENRLETVEEIASFVPSVIVTHPLGPSDNLELYRLLGTIFGRQAEAAALSRRFEAAHAEIEALVRHPIDVLYLIWRDPWMTVSRDTYISRTLALVGWNTVPAESTDRYPLVIPSNWAGRVERVLLSTEPYRFRVKHIPELESLVPGATVTLVDGEMTSWYGSRAIAAMGYLRDLSQPTVVPRPRGG